MSSADPGFRTGSAGRASGQPVLRRRTSALATRQLVAGYGDVPMVRESRPGGQGRQLVAVVGPNGAGKSTLLKAILGLATR